MTVARKRSYDFVDAIPLNKRVYFMV